MSAAEATVIADEQIAYWRALGLTADMAWRALGLPWAWAVEWWEVRAYMRRWTLAHDPAAAELRRAA